MIKARVVVTLVTDWGERVTDGRVLRLDLGGGHAGVHTRPAQQLRRVRFTCGKLCPRNEDKKKRFAL